MKTGEVLFQLPPNHCNSIKPLVRKRLSSSRKFARLHYRILRLPKSDLTMEYFRLRRIEESDIETIVQNAGGRRAVPDESVEDDPNADFILNEVVLELKIVEEEGFEKAQRQQKLAELFSTNQPGRPVLIIDPQRLSPREAQRYYRILEQPIKGGVKKAARQLESTNQMNGGERRRVLVVINNGYSALSHEELKRVVVKCAKNDTSKIDYVVVGGMYHYSDLMDTYVFCPFECVGINFEGEFESFQLLKDKWHVFAQAEMTEVVMRTEEVRRQKYPVLDLEFDVGTIRCVKPAPQWGQRSGFYPKGRPRNNSTGIHTCPPVATLYPKFTQAEWDKLKADNISTGFLGESYTDWIQRKNRILNGVGTLLRPLVEVDVSHEALHEWIEAKGKSACEETIHEFSQWLFSAQVKAVIDQARELGQGQIVPSSYILLHAELIGMDEANDLMSIFDVSHVPGLERVCTLLLNARCTFLHGLAIAAAYAIKLNRTCVLYRKDLTYCWH